MNMEVFLLTLSGSFDRPTDQPTGQPTDQQSNNRLSYQQTTDGGVTGREIVLPKSLKTPNHSLIFFVTLFVFFVYFDYSGVWVGRLWIDSSVAIYLILSGSTCSQEIAFLPRRT